MHKVLIVDDEPFVRVSLASLRNWADEGFDFAYEAGNGRQALERLDAQADIDIVLLDLVMPVMDGIAFLEALAAAPAGARRPAVVVLSAHDSFALVRKAFTLGACDYALKTEIDGAGLLALLAKAAGRLAPPAGAAAAPRDELLEDGHREFLRGQILRDLLADPPPPEHQALFARFGIRVAAPLALVLVRVADFESVSRRFGPGGMGRFNELLVRTLAMALDQRWSGEAVQIAADQAVLFVQAGGGEWLADLQAAVREATERYLNLRVELAAGRTCGRMADVRAAWEELRARRSGGSRIVLQARRYLNEHYAQAGLSLGELADHVGVSRNHLSWEFARETGETITEYLARVRVDEAARLLAATGLKVYEVAERVGYPNVEHFGRIFKRLMGVSPHRYVGGAAAGPDARPGAAEPRPGAAEPRPGGALAGPGARPGGALAGPGAVEPRPGGD